MKLAARIAAVAAFAAFALPVLACDDMKPAQKTTAQAKPKAEVAKADKKVDKSKAEKKVN